MKIAVLGGGSWGTALAQLTAQKGMETAIWARESETVHHINNTHKNHLFLPDIDLSPNLWASNDPHEVIGGAAAILLAVPTQFIRGFIRPLANAIPPRVPIVICSKGIETSTLCLVHEILMEELPEDNHRSLCVLSGPSFAKEVALGYPTNVTLACKDPEVSLWVREIFSARHFRPYTTTDMVGVEIGGATKNVIAIAAGASDGFGYGHNSRAGLITRGLAEIARLGAQKGANPLTMAGLSGLGDLVLTCTGDLSRNRAVGKLLALGRTKEDIIKSMNMVAEGIETARSVHCLAQKLGVEMPITEQVYRVLHQGKPVKDAVEDLLSRTLKDEVDSQINRQLSVQQAQLH